jgi:phosphatidylinositol alpha-1,6-mannosyltransferase
MERLSYELTTRISQRHPTVVVAMRPGAWMLPGFLVVAASRLLVACARGEVDLVHLSDGVLAPLALIPRAFRIPVSVTLHGLDVVCRAPLYRLWRAIFLGRLDSYVCNSSATRDVAARSGLPPARLHVIGIGVDAPSTKPPLHRERECLLFVGRLVRRKGLAWFVRHVLPALASDRPALRLVVIGDGPERDAIHASAREAGVADRLSLLASQSDAEKESWYARATLCVMPNIRVPGDMEGFGIVALEAAAARCAVVASDLEGLRDALAGGRVGTLVASEDAQAWIRALRERLDDDAGRERAAEDARRYVLRRCRWDDIVTAYERLFAAEVVARRRRFA